MNETSGVYLLPNELKNIELFIFDVDDTLLYTYMNGYRKITAIHNQLYGRELAFNDFICLYGKETFENCISKWFPDKEQNYIIEKYRSYSQIIEYQKIGNIRSVQNKILENGGSFGIISNSPSERLLNRLQNTTIDIDQVLFLWGRDEIDEIKPSPKGFLKVSEKYDISHNKIVYIGDSEEDMIASLRANIKFIPVKTGIKEWDIDRSFILLDSIENLLEYL